jgi:hypothetical protein
MRLGLAIRAFWAALFNHQKAVRLEEALASQSPSSQSPSGRSFATEPHRAELSRAERTKTDQAQSGGKPVAAAPSRSDALTLLSALQREARFLDLVQESLDSYSDAQVGAAARDVIKQSRAVLQRMFGIERLVAHNEGDPIPIPENPTAVRWRLIQNSSLGATQSESIQQATVVHPGWQAKHVQLPQWTGSHEDALVLAPTEVDCQ